MKTKTTPDFIDDLKAKYSLKSNYAVAKFLGQTDTAVARWAHGKGSFSDETAMQFADFLETDPAYVVACMHAERAKRDEEKKLWERIAKLTAGVAAALLAVAFLPITPPLNLDYSTIAMAGVTGDVMHNVYYVKYAINPRRIKRRKPVSGFSASA